MSNHLSGSKRLAVIQRWINGHDDPNWEVLPTRKEGKYIVKKRESPLEETQETPEETEEIPEPEVIEEKPKKVKPQRMKMPKPQRIPENQDPTVNLEILNQLKLLGEEIKMKREKKEQKRMISEAVNKQINKPKMYYPQSRLEYPQDIVYQPQPQAQQQIQLPQEPPQPEPYYEQYQQPMMFTRRNRIFDDFQ